MSIDISHIFYEYLRTEDIIKVQTLSLCCVLLNLYDNGDISCNDVWIRDSQYPMRKTGNGHLMHNFLHVPYIRLHPSC